VLSADCSVSCPEEVMLYVSFVLFLENATMTSSALELPSAPANTSISTNRQPRESTWLIFSTDTIVPPNALLCDDFTMYVLSGCSVFRADWMSSSTVLRDILTISALADLAPVKLKASGSFAKPYCWLRTYASCSHRTDTIVASASTIYTAAARKYRRICIV
jgi:hypothetical protein